MTTATAERVAAEDRLLDAELACLLGRPAAEPAPTGENRWLAAALVLLGVFVAAATWWSRDADADWLQDPPPLPPQVRVDRPQDLAALPADIANLACWLDGPGDLAELRRFRGLRSLTVVARDPGQGLGRIGSLWHVDRSWAAPPADVLAPLAELPALETLRLPSAMTVRGEHLAALARAPALRELCVGPSIVVDDAFVAALAGVPRVRTLHLYRAPLDPAAITRLSRARLAELVLDECPGLDAGALAALGGLRTLQRIEFVHLGAPPIGAEGPPGTVAIHQPDGAAMASLRELPLLRSLRFSGCVVDDSVLAGLPAGLEELSLYSTSGFTDDGLRSLRRLGGLRRFRFRERAGYTIVEQHRVAPVAAAAAIADALGALRLRSFDYTGATPAELLRALADQPDLQDLSFAVFLESGPVPLLDLEPLAQSRSLRTLTLLNQTHLDDDALQPLAACRSLRRLTAYACGAITREGAAAVLPGVQTDIVPPAVRREPK